MKLNWQLQIDPVYFPGLDAADNFLHLDLLRLHIFCDFTLSTLYVHFRLDLAFIFHGVSIEWVHRVKSWTRIDLEATTVLTPTVQVVATMRRHHGHHETLKMGCTIFRALEIVVLETIPRTVRDQDNLMDESILREERLIADLHPSFRRPPQNVHSSD